MTDEPSHKDLRPVPFAKLREKLGITDEAFLAAGPVPIEGTDIGAHDRFDLDRGVDEPSQCDGRLRITERPGPIWLATCDQCRWEVGIPAANLDAQIRSAHLLERAELEQRFLDREFERTPETDDARRAMRDWMRDGELLPAPALWGKPGRGKTHLMSLVVREVIVRRDVVAWFRSMPQLLAELQSAFDTPEYNRVWGRATMVPLLVLDDLGAEMDSDWKADRVDALIDERYRHELPIVLTTNVAPADWQEAFGARSASRLSGMTFAVEVAGRDWRQDGRQMELAGHSSKEGEV